MGLWGTLTGLGVTAVTGGNVAAGAAAATAVNSATSSTKKSSCPGAPNAEAEYLLQHMSAADRQTLSNAAAPIGGQYAYQAIRANDAIALAFHVAGGDDCKVTSTEGKAFVATFYQLVEKYGVGSGGAAVPTTTGGPIQATVEGIKGFFGGIIAGASEGAAAAAQSGAAGSQTAALGSSLLLPLLFGLVLFMLLRRRG
jgi:hypothetical protein